MSSIGSRFPAAVAPSVARGLMALALSAALPGSAFALSAADLTVTLSGPATAASGAAVTYNATVRNVPVWGRVCYVDPDVKRRICEVDVVSADAFGVTVDVALPPGFAPTGASGPGFTCQLGQTVRCTASAVWAGDAETLTVTATAPTVSANTAFTATATVDPTGSVAERSESNNGASQTITVSPPPVPPAPRADLWAVEDVTPASFFASQSVTFTVSVHNLGPAAAGGFAVQMYTNLPAGISRLTTGAFTCNAGGGFDQALDIRCTGGLPAYSSSTLTLELKTSDSYLPTGTAFTLYGYLDQPNQIPESNEGNNTFTRAAIVK